MLLVVGLLAAVLLARLLLPVPGLAAFVQYMLLCSAEFRAGAAAVVVVVVVVDGLVVVSVVLLAASAP